MQKELEAKLKLGSREMAYKPITITLVDYGELIVAQKNITNLEGLLRQQQHTKGKKWLQIKRLSDQK